MYDFAVSTCKRRSMTSYWAFLAAHSNGVLPEQSNYCGKCLPSSTYSLSLPFSDDGLEPLIYGGDSAKDKQAAILWHVVPKITI